MSLMNIPQIKQKLREIGRSKRKALDLASQKDLSLALLKCLRTQSLFLNSQNIAAYYPKDAEIDPRPLIELSWNLGKRCFLPVLDPLKSKKLLFMEYTQNDPLFPNRFGVLEPPFNSKRLIPSWFLDLVFVPLIAFDNKGHRLGRGGGYYDHTFAYFKENVRSKRPKLIGLAYEFQEVDAIPEEAWDLQLTGVATEKQFILFNN